MMRNNTPPYSCSSVEYTHGGRIVTLDIIRIVLAFLIFLFHSRIHLKCSYGYLNEFIGNGHIVAMTAFFMLSGYSLFISNGSREFTDSNDYVRFYKKRFISIYPLYLFVGCCFVAMMVALGIQSLEDNIILIPIELLCLQSFFETLFPLSHNSGTWFISCLMFCYFVFPLLLKLMMRWRRLIIVILCLVLLLSYVPYITKRFDVADTYTNPFFRMLEFFVGMIIARVNQVRDCKKMAFSSFAILVSVLVLLVGVSLLDYKYWLPITCFSIILYGVKEVKFICFQNNKTIRYLSSISYAFFLGQFFVWIPIKGIMKRIDFIPSNILLIVTSFCACLFFAVLLYEFVEKPSKAWLRNRMLV